MSDDPWETVSYCASMDAPGAPSPDSDCVAPFRPVREPPATAPVDDDTGITVFSEDVSGGADDDTQKQSGGACGAYDAHDAYDTDRADPFERVRAHIASMAAWRDDGEPTLQAVPAEVAERPRAVLERPPPLRVFSAGRFDLAPAGPCSHCLDTRDSLRALHRSVIQISAALASLRGDLALGGLLGEDGAPGRGPGPNRRRRGPERYQEADTDEADDYGHGWHPARRRDCHADCHADCRADCGRHALRPRRARQY